MYRPDISFKKIRAVNAAIDSPSRKMVALQNAGIFDPAMFDLFKLRKTAAHRKYNHSVPSAFIAAYMVDPKNAAELALIHLMADRMGNYYHDRFGTSDKEVIEALVNKQYDMFQMTKGAGIKGRNKRKQMFF